MDSHSKPEIRKKELSKRQKQTPFLFLIIILGFVGFNSYSTGNLKITLIIMAIMFSHDYIPLILQWLFKLRIHGYTFIPYLVEVLPKKFKDTIPSQFQRVIIHLSTPFLLVVVGGILFNSPDETTQFAGIISLIMTALFLLPIDPLNGAKLLADLFPESKLIITLISTFSLSLIFIVMGASMQDLFFILFGLLIGFRVNNYHKKWKIHRFIKNEVNLNQTLAQMNGEDYWKLRALIIENLSPLNQLDVPQDTEWDREDIIQQIMADFLIPENSKTLNQSGRIAVLFTWIILLLTSAVLIAHSDIDFESLSNVWN